MYLELSLPLLPKHHMHRIGDTWGTQGHQTENSNLWRALIHIAFVTSHIAWEWGCAYMYKCTIYDTMRFKVVMVMNLSELRS